jgi:hypothetical protein
LITQGWIGVDLDGTLARYDGWKGDTHIGDPIPLMLARVKRWVAEGKDVRIFTARVGDQGEFKTTVEQCRKAIEDWCQKWIGKVLPVTCTKDYRMIELWDDRAIQVIPNTGFVVDWTQWDK